MRLSYKQTPDFELIQTRRKQNLKNKKEAAERVGQKTLKELNDTKKKLGEALSELSKANRQIEALKAELEEERRARVTAEEGDSVNYQALLRRFRGLRPRRGDELVLAALRG